MKNSHLFGAYFPNGMTTQMMLKRYDGEHFWSSLPDIEPKHYLWWITDRSIKPVEKLTTAVFQITEAS